ncbi:MAG: sulfate ABC transporter ATP-binding protein [Oscillospiraceae bacterium]|nr:sulfate ABC transporter ATP-binding protein [Oscillospiraceae bacterium]
MYIELKNLNKTFGNFKAFDNVSFGIEKGRLIGLLGPSGSGKTTILRMIAGLEKQDSGDIFMNGRNIGTLSASERGIGFVFQSYALFPYLNVYQNIAYGLKVQKRDKKYIDNRVDELLNLVGLPGLEKRYPDQLSGSQRQRIALARALAPEPELLLLDEPFAAIDAKIRKELRTWLRQTIDKIGITSVFVTHDQEEAMEVADEIVITNNGKVEQMGTPAEIYLNPKTPFVAQFMGKSTVLDSSVTLKGFSVPQNSAAIIRTEFMEIHKLPHKGRIDYESAMEDGAVQAVIFQGNTYEIHIQINGFTVVGEYPLQGAPLKKGDNVKVFIKQIYLIDQSEAKTVMNKALDTSDIYYI